jgi:UDP-N-acetylglucosamine--N-acetylmuramyl-(pentapeptide) pyrophosphoryl-undecaprenol N-acetylglucosamine transferase
VLGEYPAVGVASVLVPYPYAGAHQRLNALRLVESGAAVLLEDEALPSGALGRTVCDLLADRQRLAALRSAARGLARPKAAREIADQLITLAERKAA